MQVNNLVVIADLHAGCRLGLCPSGPINLDDGGTYTPSRAQAVTWEWWNEFWNDWVPDVTRGEPFAVVVNGDAVDGRHHGAVTQISQNLSDQARIAKMILAPVRDRAAGGFYMIRGTEAHVGPSAENEENLARELGAIPNEEGQYSRHEAWFRLRDKYLVHCAHHIGTTGSMHYESTAPMKELTEAYIESARWNNEPPDVVVRSHRHRVIEDRALTYKGFATVCVTPGWQLKTPFAYRIAGARQALPQIGGTLVRAGDEDCYTRHFVKTLARPEEAKL
jgi:hypothetical protein